MTSQKYARVEYERKFLLAGLPTDLVASDFLHLVDHYLHDARLRLRRMSTPDGRVLQYKFGQKRALEDGNANGRWMTNLYLDAAEYEQLLQLGGDRLEKRRYKFPHGPHHFSLDEFLGPLEGLWIAEIEKPNLTELMAIAPPDFAIREVTAEPTLEGAYLARNGRPGFLDEI